MRLFACAALRGALRRAVIRKLIVSDEKEAVLSREADIQLRGMHPVPSPQAETQVRGLRRLPSRQSEKRLRGLHSLPPRQAET